MSKKIDERIPRELGEGVLPMHAAIKSPWDKLMSYHDAAHYVQRYQGVISAAIMQAFRILVPDYVDRSKAICKNAYNRLAYLNRIPGVAAYQTTENNSPPAFPMTSKPLTRTRSFTPSTAWRCPTV